MKEYNYTLFKRKWGRSLLRSLCICVCVSFCACQRMFPGNNSALRETEQDISQEEKAFLDKYNDFFITENAKRAALLYLDEDSVPELLVLKNGEYKLYSFDGSEVKSVTMPDTEIKANAYGTQYDIQGTEYQTFYRFEYVPYKGLIRVHSGAGQERHDYYLRYADGLFSVELETKSTGDTWHTYDAEKEITNEEFLSQLSGLGYDKLIPCSYLYENVAAAYENIGASSDNRKVLEDFVNGNIDAVDYVGEISDVPEESFVMRSYKEFYDDITAGEDIWGRKEYIDFDNDGEDELIIHGYTGACLFFDVIGDTVYKVLHTGSTTDAASVAVFGGKRVIERTDLTHGGRKYYWIMEFDSCCCVIDRFSLHVSYEGTGYSEEDVFMYRNREISMEEFEKIVNSLGSVQ